MSVDSFLSRLEKVKRSGPDRWIARCPAHADRSPSLSIRELDDGRVLVHCFADCDVQSVLSAVGLDFDALFPDEALDHRSARERPPFNPADVLRCLGFEALVVAVGAASIAKEEPLSQEDRARLMLAASRIQAAVEVTCDA